MTIDTELVAIGIALLGIILGTWTYLHNINKKLNKLILLVGKFDKKEEDSHNTDSTQTNHQHSFACAIRSYIKKCIYNLRGKITFYRKEKYQFNNYQQVNYTTKQLRLDRTKIWFRWLSNDEYIFLYYTCRPASGVCARSGCESVESKDPEA